ncbi:MAG: arginine--tRNA ligase [Bacteroidales bacterium]|nr:arginine--tRNA ligase [Bacteroidales bacterium]
MMIEKILVDKTIKAVSKLYSKNISSEFITVEKTNKDFEGDFTIVVFPLLKFSKKSPEETAKEIGNYIKSDVKEIQNFNVIKGFLNFVINDKFWLDFFKNNISNEHYGFKKPKKTKPVIVEYSSPNTNKPLHLGHIRNNLLGYSLSEILKANGKNVIKINLINDRGIHICKSMLAWLKWGDGETPESTGIKGDHLLGKYYILFDKKNKEEIRDLVLKGSTEDEAEKNTSLMIEAQEMLRKWENADEEILDLWKLMNSWALKGFDKTYKRLGIDFDKINYESKTYLQGKALVKKGVENGCLLQKEDGSVWADLTEEGLDEKLLLRKDGTSVYITQDLGTAYRRYNEFYPEKIIYVVGNEQIYHFNVLKLVLKKLEEDWADKIMHLYYGMVELPHGRMKSREGTVVDADDLMDEMYETAKKTTEELGKIDSFPKEEADKLYHIVSMAALKYFILKVDPKKNMLFNPEESIDFNGNTGTFIQYTYARIQSIIRKAGKEYVNNSINGFPENFTLLKKEKEILKLLYEFPGVVEQAGENYSPAIIANYVYELVKEYNQFYQEIPILKNVDKEISDFRVALSEFTGNIIKKSMNLLGIEVPDRM